MGVERLNVVVQSVFDVIEENELFCGARKSGMDNERDAIREIIIMMSR